MTLLQSDTPFCILNLKEQIRSIKQKKQLLMLVSLLQDMNMHLYYSFFLLSPSKMVRHSCCLLYNYASILLSQVLIY